MLQGSSESTLVIKATLLEITYCDSVMLYCTHWNCLYEKICVGNFSVKYFGLVFVDYNQVRGKQAYSATDNRQKI